MEACGCEVDDFASWMHGFPGFTVLGVCYMQGGLGHSERGKAQEACLGLEVVCYDNYDIQSDSLIPSFRPPLQTSVLQFQQNNTKLTTPKLRQRKQMCSGRDIKKCPISVSLIVCVFFFQQYKITITVSAKHSPHPVWAFYFWVFQPGNSPARCQSVNRLTPSTIYATIWRGNTLKLQVYCYYLESFKIS